MEKYLILVKHSLPKIIEDLPAREWRLSEEGRSRAKRLAEQLMQYQPEVIVSSMELKAQETAEIVARNYNLTFNTVEGLHEHDRSDVSYLSPEQLRTSVRKFFQNPDKLVFGKETADQVHARFYRAVHSVLYKHERKTVVVVSHGTAISLFVSRLTGSSDFDLWNMLGLPSFIAMDLHSNTLFVRDYIV